MNKSAIVIGAGIVGLATARALAVRNYQVTVIERDHRAVGASVRNFGMIWPIGQPDGELAAQAMLSKRIWEETCQAAGIWYDPVGSLHVARHADELAVLEEVSAAYPSRGYKMLTRAETVSQSEAVVSNGLQGALFSPNEMIVDPRRTLEQIPLWLQEKFGVQFIWGSAVTEIDFPHVYAGKSMYSADEIYVCSGADFETLYPSVYSTLPLTRCKLQMMKMRVQPDGWRIGPAICGGLSLLHYASFKVAPSLGLLRSRIEAGLSEYLNWGIHVMVSQNGDGELIVGDSHEYGPTPDPFNRGFINEMILKYLHEFAQFKDATVVETWNGVYPKLTNGATSIVVRPESGVTIINGLGGAGMTLGFGLCEEVVAGAAEKKLNFA